MSGPTLPDHFRALYEECSHLFAAVGTPQSQAMLADVPGYLVLLDRLLHLHNHPAERHGKEKAEFIHDQLKEIGIPSQIITVPNKDPNKTANQNDAWYVVQARVEGATAGPSGLVCVHHDTVSHRIETSAFTEHTDPLYTLGHPWMIDATVQLAGVLYAAREIKRFIEGQAGAGSLTLLFTDGEEVNTLGMRGWLEQKRQIDPTPYDFVLICEATGRGPIGHEYAITAKNTLYQGEIPTIAYANRGKATGFISGASETSTVVEMFTSFAKYFRQVQKQVFLESIPSEPSALGPTVLAYTIGDFIEGSAQVFFESRSNEVINATESIRRLQAATRSDNLIDLSIPADVQRLYERVTVNVEGMILVEQDNAFTLNITNGTHIHPANYNPFERHNAQVALELIMCCLSDTERASVSRISFGSSDHPNTVPPIGEITFLAQPDIEALQSTLRQTHAMWFTMLEDMYAGATNDSIIWDVTEDPFVPVRDVVRVDDQSWWVVEKAQEALAEGIGEVFGITPPDVPTGVFNAMTDIGPATYPQHEWFWPKDSVGNKRYPVITVGVGDFSLLHTEREALSATELLISMIQYKTILTRLLTT